MKLGEIPVVIFPVVLNGHWFLMVANMDKVHQYHLSNISDKKQNIYSSYSAINLKRSKCEINQTNNFLALKKA